MNISIKQLTPDDLAGFIQMLRIFEEVFEMKDFQMPDEGHLKKLICSTDLYCQENKYKEFFVQADEADTYALEFYPATGGLAEKVQVSHS